MMDGEETYAGEIKFVNYPDGSIALKVITPETVYKGNPCSFSEMLRAWCAASYKNLHAPLYVITAEDVQEEANRIIGRKLTDEEIEQVKKLLNFGLGESIDVVMDTAITEATRKEG